MEQYIVELRDQNMEHMGENLLKIHMGLEKKDIK
jgi:hypothetical protein